MDSKPTGEQTGAAAPVCPFCQTAIALDEARGHCEECGASYHLECWESNAGCAVYGCAQAPAVEKRGELEIPVSHWGQERKPCPVCGQEIQAAALRCRHCGAVFRSARPETEDEFRENIMAEVKAPGLRRAIVLIFVFCTLTCSAPLATLLGWYWYRAHRSDIRKLAGFHRALCLTGLVLGLLQTVLVVTMAVLFAVVRR